MPLLITLVVVALTLSVVAVSVRRAWPRWRAIAEERVVEPAQGWLHPPQQVTLATLQRRWMARALHHVTVTVSGRAALPAGLVFAVSPADLDRLGDVTELMADDTGSALRRKARRHDWLVPEGFGVTVEADPDVVEGWPQVRVVRGPVTRPVAGGTPSGPALTVQARTLVLPDEASAPVAPTPAAPPAAAPPAPVLPVPPAPAAPPAPGGASARPARTALEPPTVAPTTGVDRTRAYTACELIALGDDGAVDLGAGRSVVTVGRDDGNDLVLDDTFVSGAHAELVQRGGQWVVCDRASLNGTWVNGERVVESALVHNDEISFGWSGPRYVFSRLSPDLPALR